MLFVNRDDTEFAVRRIQEIVPNIATGSLRVIENLPRQINCLVMAFSDRTGGFDYQQAIAIIRAELTPLFRQSGIHEELAQGLGLPNDSRQARPSIFNDDEEFSLLTRHDEFLLRILYDPRLTPGMPPQQARPIVRALAEQLVGASRPF